jgi:hypothetical protein
MSDNLATVETDVKTAEAQALTFLSEIKTLVANRTGDVVIAAIVVASIWIGHAL